MNCEYIRKNLTIEDLNENQQTLYEAIGKDKYLGLCHEVGGFQVYFPKGNTLYSIVLKKTKHSENTGRERSFHTMLAPMIKCKKTPKKKCKFMAERKKKR